MRLAHLAPPWIPVPPINYGGTELMVDLLVRGLRQRNLDIIVFCSGDSAIAGPKAGSFARSFWPPEKFSENFHLAYAWNFIRDNQIDLIHSHLENAAGFWYAAGNSQPLVITLHTPITDIKREYLLNFSQVHLVAVSEFQRRRLESHPHVHVIPHGLDIAAYHRKNPRDEYLLFLGRIYPEKGLHTAIAAALAAGRKLICAGPVFPPDQAYFDTEISPYLDNRHIFYVGPADFNRKLDLLSRARALLLPLEVDEAFGLVMLEAMACGTPVVAYERGAAPEVVQHGKTGFIAHDFAELLTGIEATADINPDDCRQHVACNFSLHGMIEAYLSLYRSIL